MKNTITVYACGGTGINIGNLIETNLANFNEDATPRAEIIVYYVDTSASNSKHKNIENVYLFDGMDGSGGWRTRNKDEIADYIPEIFAKMPPGNLSIVIHSASGGSGSVIGPMIAAKLLEKEKAVIDVVILSAESSIHVKNTVEVLETLEGISQYNKRVLPVLLCDNTQDSEDKINNGVFASVYSLAVLFSGDLERLDSADLDNWINFDKVTTHPCGAVLLDILSGETAFDKKDVVCSVASIVKDSSGAYAEFVEYKTMGILKDKGSSSSNLHFLLIDGPILRAHKKFNDMKEEKKNLSVSRPKRVSIAGDVKQTGGFKF